MINSVRSVWLRCNSTEKNWLTVSAVSDLDVTQRKILVISIKICKFILGIFGRLKGSCASIISWNCRHMIYRHLNDLTRSCRFCIYRIMGGNIVSWTPFYMGSMVARSSYFLQEISYAPPTLSLKIQIISKQAKLNIG